MSVLRSMTGFAEVQNAQGAEQWRWEIRSVNNKGRDVKPRLPQGWEALETEVRQRVAACAARGSITVSLRRMGVSGEPALEVDWAFLTRLQQDAREAGFGVEAAELSLGHLLQVRGAIRSQADDAGPGLDDTLSDLLLADLDPLLERWNAVRLGEGARLGEVLLEMLARISELIGLAGAEATDAPANLQEKLEARLADLGAAVDPDRLAQEVALLATKADVTEELDRLRMHVAAARDLLTKGSPCGRKLEFLAQEFMREANTLCSKSAHASLTRIGLDLKEVIDQFREQIQNVE